MTLATSCSSGKRCSGQSIFHLFMAEIQTGDLHMPLAHLGTDAARVHRVEHGMSAAPSSCAAAFVRPRSAHFVPA